MTRFFPALLFLPLLSAGQASNTFMNENNRFLEDLTGNPVKLRTEYTMEGSPFFNDAYCAAVIKVARGKLYSGLQAKLNLQDNIVYYRLANGSELEAVSPIDYIVFSECTPGGRPVLFRSGYPSVDLQTTGNYYQVLDSGNVQLLKFVKLSYIDQKPYGGAGIIRRFDNSVVYYAYTPQRGMIRLGRGNEMAASILPGKEKDAAQFINSQNLRLKKEDDLIKLFAFYNRQ